MVTVDVHMPPPGLSPVRCSRCFSLRILRADGTPGVCSHVHCPAPLQDVNAERARRLGAQGRCHMIDDQTERAWWVIQIVCGDGRPGGIAHVPADTEEQARRQLVDSSWPKAPVHTWPLLSSRWCSREAVWRTPPRMLASLFARGREALSVPRRGGA